jgi:hypothetical protein
MTKEQQNRESEKSGEPIDKTAPFFDTIEKFIAFVSNRTFGLHKNLTLTKATIDKLSHELAGHKQQLSEIETVFSKLENGLKKVLNEFKEEIRNGTS